MAKYEEYALYDIFVDGIMVAEGVFGWEVAEEIDFFKKCYNNGFPHNISAVKCEE